MVAPGRLVLGGGKRLAKQGQGQDSAGPTARVSGHYGTQCPCGGRMEFASHAPKMAWSDSSSQRGRAWAPVNGCHWCSALPPTRLHPGLRQPTDPKAQQKDPPPPNKRDGMFSCLDFSLLTIPREITGKRRNTHQILVFCSILCFDCVFLIVFSFAAFGL